jgi:hypothetical protein
MAVSPRPARGRKTIRRGPGQQIVGGRDFRLADEVRYIQRRAADHHGRIVTIGQLILFSTETGDAWLLDPADRLAGRLARDGASEPIHIEESDTTFVIGWKGAIASRDPPLSIQTTRAAGRQRSSVTRPISSPRSVEL